MFNVYGMKCYGFVQVIVLNCESVPSTLRDNLCRKLFCCGNICRLTLIGPQKNFRTFYSQKLKFIWPPYDNIKIFRTQVYLYR